jgi:hypothetical protein
MKTKSMLNIFTGIGALLTVLSFFWWALVYHFVSKQNGESMWSSVNCLYSIGTDCNFLRAMGWLRGVDPYEPLLFWMGLMMLLISRLVMSSLKKDSLVKLK